jgi:hypothetical protein
MSSEKVILKTFAGKFEQQEEYLRRMEPPKFVAPRQVARKTQSSTRSSQEPAGEEKVHTQPEGIIDVKAIPSPQDETVITTLVEEEGKSPKIVRMDIDP